MWKTDEDDVCEMQRQTSFANISDGDDFWGENEDDDFGDRKYHTKVQHLTNVGWYHAIEGP